MSRENDTFAVHVPLGVPVQHESTRQSVSSCLVTNDRWCIVYQYDFGSGRDFGSLETYHAPMDDTPNAPVPRRLSAAKSAVAHNVRLIA